MALKDQPYLPLYIQDVLTDEKLIECSAEAHGVYFRLICILHKQEQYGLLTLKQKYKQTENKYENFATMLNKQMPFPYKQILECLKELQSEDVVQIDENNLSQKRMIYDGKLSLTRVETGKKGGKGATKQYGKAGYLYFISDSETKNKIGISLNPQNRLYRLRSDLNLKRLEIIDYIEVKDMGKSEDFAIEFFGNNIDGEWLTISFDECKKQFDLLKAKLQAKPKAKTKAKTKANAENETENINENKIDFKGVPGEIVLPFQSESFKNSWEVWKEYKQKTFRFKFKTPESEQAALKLLSKFDEPFTIGLIERAMANQYKGLVFDSTDRDYQNYLTEKNNGNKHTTKTGQSAGQKPHGLQELRDVSAQILEAATGTSDTQASD